MAGHVQCRDTTQPIERKQNEAAEGSSRSARRAAAGPPGARFVHGVGSVDRLEAAGGLQVAALICGFDPADPTRGRARQRAVVTLGPVGRRRGGAAASTITPSRSGFADRRYAVRRARSLVRRVGLAGQLRVRLTPRQVACRHQHCGQNQGLPRGPSEDGPRDVLTQRGVPRRGRDGATQAREHCSTDNPPRTGVDAEGEQRDRADDDRELPQAQQPTCPHPVHEHAGGEHPEAAGAEHPPHVTGEVSTGPRTSHGPVPARFTTAKATVTVHSHRVPRNAVHPCARSRSRFAGAGGVLRGRRTRARHAAARR